MTPAEVAARLTPAQKRALLWLPGDGQPRMGWPVTAGTERALLRMRLVARWRVCRSVEDARKRGAYAPWQPDEPSSTFDAHSVTVPKHHFGAGVFRAVDGLAVRAVLEKEDSRG